MDLKSRQEMFDRIKWYDSLLVGEDRCGTYHFCMKCRKKEKYPCARAMARYEGDFVRVAVVHKRS